MKLGESVRTPVQLCLSCGKTLDAAACIDSVNGEAIAPDPGTITVCIDCGHVMIFDDDLRLREPTDEEREQIASDERLRAMLDAREQYRQDFPGTVHQPKNSMPRIESIYAFLSVDKEEGNEGVVGAAFRGGSPMPLLAADERRLADLMPVAERIAEQTGTQIKLVRFTAREEIATFPKAKAN